MITATKNQDYANDVDLYRDKRITGSLALVAMTPEAKLREVVTARFYGTGATVYCNLWIASQADSNPYTASRGKGRADGGGYHKPRAALAKAIESAGYVLSEDIAGCGEGAMERAMLAIAAEQGYTGETLFVRT